MLTTYTIYPYSGEMLQCQFNNLLRNCESEQIIISKYKLLYRRIWCI